MSVIMEETGRAPMEYVGRGKVTSQMRRRADFNLKKLEKYFGKPISTR